VKRWILWVPFAVFSLIGIVAAWNLVRPADRLIPSQLVGKPLPAFSLPEAMPGRPTIQRADYGTGQPRMLNVFASWCVPCIAEAPQLMELARRGIPIDAVAIRDRPEDVARFLDQWGDPYRNIALDADAGLQLSIGSSGVPETYIVDGRGTIRYQHIGAINATDMPRIVEEFEKAKG
jgi:cytochrome c biogenesis protein CcmG, thiol:disulfide interchange protein DsbE